MPACGPGARFRRQYAGVRRPGPRKDIDWVTASARRVDAAVRDGKIDAYMGFPPVPQELRAKKIGHVVVNSAVDRPWSQYFCCMVAANREFVRKHPVATKRALRAILKAADICALEPERAASSSWKRASPRAMSIALQAMKEIPYGRWREYDPEDTMRFYALRLHEVGMIKSAPEDHRPGHRLALPQRAEEGVEGVKS